MDPFYPSSHRQPRSIYTGSTASSRSEFETTRYPRVSRTRKSKHEHDHDHNDPSLLRLRKDFSFNTPYFNQANTLTHIITHNSPHLLTFILTHPSPSNPKLTTHHLTNLLHLAISHGQKSSIPILLTHGADINGLNTHGISPLQASIREKESRQSIAILLIEHGADLTLGSPLHWAARRNWADVISALYNHGVDIDSLSSTANSPLDMGITHRHGIWNEIESETGGGRDRGITALHVAVYYSSLSAARALITHGATVSLSTQAAELALAEAISNTCIPMVDLLLTSGIRLDSAVDAQGGTPLMAAVCLDNVGLVRCLMGHGAWRTVGVCDVMGETVWHVGARWAGVDVLRVLVESCGTEGVTGDLGVRNEKGETPLEVAVREGREVGVVKVLIRAGARLDEGVEGAMGSCGGEVVELLDSWFGTAGRGRGRVGRKGRGFDEEDQQSTISQETVRPRAGDGVYDRRMTRYTRPSPGFMRSDVRDISPDYSFDDRTTTSVDLESSLESLSLSEWSPDLDRRMVRKPRGRYEDSEFGAGLWKGSKGSSIFSEDWGEGFDEGFREERGRRDVRVGRRGRGRVTSVSFTVYR
ncbi:hypothetical protein ACEPPN_008590 [Leptodophora sp. 'Broadleaf-Isolate-01']